jgi:hypothetical protein
VHFAGMKGLKALDALDGENASATASERIKERLFDVLHTSVRSNGQAEKTIFATHTKEVLRRPCAWQYAHESKKYPAHVYERSTSIVIVHICKSVSLHGICRQLKSVKIEQVIEMARCDERTTRDCLAI